MFAGNLTVQSLNASLLVNHSLSYHSDFREPQHSAYRHLASVCALLANVFILTGLIECVNKIHTNTGYLQIDCTSQV